MSTDEFREPPSLYLPPANGDVWREGDVLVCTAGANLPPRCVKCNAPADMPPRRYIFHWHHPVIYAALLLGVLPYVILAIALRKRSAARAYPVRATRAPPRALCRGGDGIGVGIAGVRALDRQPVPVADRCRRDGGDAVDRPAGVARVVADAGRPRAGTVSGCLRCIPERSAATTAGKAPALMQRGAAVACAAARPNNCIDYTRRSSGVIGPDGGVSWATTIGPRMDCCGMISSTGSPRAARSALA